MEKPPTLFAVFSLLGFLGTTTKQLGSGATCCGIAALRVGYWLRPNASNHDILFEWLVRGLGDTLRSGSQRGSKVPKWTRPLEWSRAIAIGVKLRKLEFCQVGKTQ